MTYSEILEATAAKVFHNLRKDPEFSKNKDIYFYKPKKEEVFEYVYQIKLAELLVKNGLLKGEPVKKLAKGENLSLKDWEALREEWFYLWKRCFKDKTCVVACEYAANKPYVSSRFKGDAYRLIRCVLEAHLFALQKITRILAKKALSKNCDVILELHNTPLDYLMTKDKELYDGMVAIFPTNMCLNDPSIVNVLNILKEKLLLPVCYVFPSANFPTIYIEIFSKTFPKLAWSLPRLVPIWKDRKALVLPQASTLLLSRRAVEMSYPIVKLIIKSFTLENKWVTGSCLQK